ncbi:MAG: hypothetical protein AAGJ31_01890 [Verrucomicrobiota bacterium]
MPIEDLNVPWIIVAMIFISFLRFIVDNLRKKNEDEEDEDFEDWDEDEATETAPQQRGSAPPPVVARRSPTSQTSSPGDELRRFLESLREPEVQPSKPPPPPPPPEPEEVPQRTEVSAEQKEAAKAFQSRSIGTRSTSSHGTNLDLQELLGDPAALRKAILLREILGPPAALRDQGHEPQV